MMVTFSPAMVRRLAVELVGMLTRVVRDAGYGEEDYDGGVPLMVLATATVLGAMLTEDGAVAADSANAALAAHGSQYRLVAVN